MQISVGRTATLALALGAVIFGGWQVSAQNSAVTFPEGFEKGVHYTTVRRGNVREDLFTSPEAIEAIKNGQPMPAGTNVVLVDYRDGQLFRYFVMQKGSSSRLNTSGREAGGWGFEWFNADKSINLSSDSGRCISCHTSQASDDFLFTADRMREAR